jgi:hypothetical protein
MPSRDKGRGRWVSDRRGRARKRSRLRAPS